MLEPDLLRTFLAVADLGSFTRAGAAVGRTQSAVSMQVRRLEEQLRCRLFRRSAHSVVLTPQGELLRRQARLVLNAQQAALAALSQAEVSYEISLAVPDDYALGLLPAVLRECAAIHPKAAVNVTCEPSREIIQAMAAGAYDLALVTEGQGPVEGPIVHQEPCQWVVAAEGDAQRREPLPLAFGRGGDTYRQWAVDALVEQGRAFRMVYTSASMAAIRAAVLSGLAVSAMAESSMTAGMRALTPAEGFPALPRLRVRLITSPQGRSDMVQQLAAQLAERMRGRAGRIVAGETPRPRRAGRIR